MNNSDLEYTQNPSAMVETISGLPNVILNKNVEDYFSRYIDIDDPLTSFSLLLQNNSKDNCKTNNYINLKRLNEIQHLDTFLNLVNTNLPCGGIFICCAETLDQRKNRIFNKYHKLFAYPYYYLLDFPGKRFFPKFEFTRKIHDLITDGNNKTLSFTEVMGRLVYSGFNIIDYEEINNLTYFITNKEKEPLINQSHSYGMFFKMKRVGKDRKIIYAYKIRTMHPYAEYIQKDILNLNGSVNGDKIENDFRVTSWGRFLRKYWLDELPMIINLIKGDIKLVGVRPLSVTKFELYPEELQKLRVSVKPGLIPPFYADLPNTFDELLESERKYLLAYKKNPLKTDIKYFFKSMYNINIKHSRSS